MNKLDLYRLDWQQLKRYFERWIPWKADPKRRRKARERTKR